MASKVTPLHTSSPWLYDSVAPDGHVWRSELLRMQTAPQVEDRCLGANLAMDARVAPPAQVQWATAVGAPISLLEALSQQWGQAYIRQAPAVRFTGSACRLPAKRGLSHVEPFSGLFRRALGTSPALLAELDASVADATGTVGLIHGLKAPGDYAALAMALNTVDADEFKDIIGLALYCIDRQGPRPFWWATLSDEVAGHGDNATAICSTLGLGNYAEGSWVIVFDYKVADAGLLYRPTTLDAGGYAFHFPSPQSHAQGLSMALRASETPCTEILHHALPWAAAADSVRPRVLRLERAWTAQQAYDELPTQRQQHRATLQGRFLGEQLWLGRHNHRI